MSELEESLKNIRWERMNGLTLEKVIGVANSVEGDDLSDIEMTIYPEKRKAIDEVIAMMVFDDLTKYDDKKIK